MGVINRQAVRDSLATILGAVLVGDGKLCEAIYNYRTDNFNGASPVIVVCSRGSDRDKMTQVSVVNTDVLLYIYTFVLYTDGGTWTPALSEDRLDDIEALITDTMYANFNNPGIWVSIDFDQQSQVEPIVIGDEMYQREMFFVKADAYSD